MEINFNTDKIICLHYPPLAGGKVIANLLALSKSVDLQHFLLSQKLITPSQKLEYLLGQLKQELPIWNDLGLGHQHQGFTVFPKGDMGSYIWDEKVVAQITHSEKYFVYVNHYFDQLNFLKNTWPNATYILLTSPYRLIKQRADSDINVEQMDAIWNAELPITNPNTISFPISTIFDKSLFLRNIEDLYLQLGLNDFNKNYTESYYDLYFKKIRAVPKAGYKRW
jgi:hypothetical protein